MWSSLYRNRGHSWLLLLMRGLIRVFAVTGGLWALTALPSFWSTVPARDVMERILVDDRFKQGVLGEIQSWLETRQASAVQHPDIERAKALVALRASEGAMDRAGPDAADREVEVAESRTRISLALNPADSFLWLMLYSLTTSRGGFDDVLIRFLDQSYSIAPLESWIALRRNRMALAVFPLLGRVTQQSVVSEFEAMVDSNFTEEASFNLTGVGWPQRDRLLESLTQADIASREALAKRLASDGVIAGVPGVVIDERLWR